MNNNSLLIRRQLALLGLGTCLAVSAQAQMPEPIEDADSLRAQIKAARNAAFESYTEAAIAAADSPTATRLQTALAEGDAARLQLRTARQAESPDRTAIVTARTRLAEASRETRGLLRNISRENEGVAALRPNVRFIYSDTLRIAATEAAGERSSVATALSENAQAQTALLAQLAALRGTPRSERDPSAVRQLQSQLRANREQLRGLLTQAAEGDADFRSDLAALEADRSEGPGRVRRIRRGREHRGGGEHSGREHRGGDRDHDGQDNPEGL